MREGAWPSFNTSERKEWSVDYLHKIFTPRDVDELSNVVPDIYVEGMLRCGEVTTLGANTKSHKTFACEQLAVCLRNGLPFLGQDVKRMENVLIIDFESQENTIRRRLKSIQETLQKDYSDQEIIVKPGIHIITLRGKTLDFSDKDTQKALIDKIGESASKVFILDPWYKTYLGKNENDNSLMALEVNYWINICAETNTGCVGIDHFSKGEQYQKRSIDRIVGAGTKGRSGDNLVTLSECYAKRKFGLTESSIREEGEFYLMEMTLRDLAPQPSVIIEWTWPIFRVVDLKFDGFKAKSQQDYGKPQTDGIGGASAPGGADGIDGRGKDKYSDEELLRPLPLQSQSEGLTVDEWLKEFKSNAPSRSRLYERIQKLKAPPAKIVQKGNKYSRA